MSKCELCPRRCGVDRQNGERGYCAQSDSMRIAMVSLHPFEEPPISGKHGSGTIFFCGCSLGCIFCQNKSISRQNGAGREYTVEMLAQAMIELRDRGATNISLVTASHFTDKVAQTLRYVKPKLSIPVVWNSSGYESVEALRMLEGLVDIYLPDFKYMSVENASLYSSAPDYPTVAEAAVAEMYRQVGKYSLSEDGTLTKGMIVRHLVLPSCRKDSVAVLRKLAETVPPSDILLSLMSQYTPDFALDAPYTNLHRRITSFEYESVLREAERLGFEGFSQSVSSAVKEYTPNF